jgi:hypothetical protein
MVAGRRGLMPMMCLPSCAAACLDQRDGRTPDVRSPSCMASIVLHNWLMERRIASVPHLLSNRPLYGMRSGGRRMLDSGSSFAASACSYGPSGCQIPLKASSAKRSGNHAARGLEAHAVGAWSHTCMRSGKPAPPQANGPLAGGLLGAAPAGGGPGGGPESFRAGASESLGPVFSSSLFGPPKAPQPPLQARETKF